MGIKLKNKVDEKWFWEFKKYELLLIKILFLKNIFEYENIYFQASEPKD